MFKDPCADLIARSGNGNLQKKITLQRSGGRNICKVGLDLGSISRDFDTYHCRVILPAFLITLEEVDTTLQLWKGGHNLFDLWRDHKLQSFIKSILLEEMDCHERQKIGGSITNTHIRNSDWPLGYLTLLRGKVTRGSWGCRSFDSQDIYNFQFTHHPVLPKKGHRYSRAKKVSLKNKQRG